MRSIDKTTSREALIVLHTLAIGSERELRRLSLIIKKDLDVLDILKNKNVNVDLIKNIMKDNRKFECYPDDNLTQEEFNKIKEWLESE